MIREGLAVLAAALIVGGQPASSEGVRHKIVDWTELQGWAHDDHDAALSVFMETCPDLTDPQWSVLCAVAQNQKNARTFFELFFRPVVIDDGSPALFTGYFEPELRGSRQKTDVFNVPLYAMPPEMPTGTLWHSRAEIEEQQLLEGRGLELAWVEDPVDAFFLQIQGSGRIALDNGSKLRLGFAGKNGHDYRSVGQELVRRGVYQQHQVSAQVIRNWVQRNPVEGAELLRHNPSYVFFRELSEISDSSGPLGAMNRPISALRSIAVDPEFTPLGAPVWIEKQGEMPLRRLMIAQDTGSAIKGAQRADIFFGSGPRAGERAGKIKDPGRLVTLLPIEVALKLDPEG